MHLQNTSDTLFLVLGCVQAVRSGIDRTGIHAEERKLTDEGIRHDLERKCRKRLRVRRVTNNLVAVQVGSLDRRDIDRAGHILDDRIDHLLDALVTVRAAAGHRDRTALAGRLAKGSLHVLYRRLLALQVDHHQLLIQITALLDQLCVIQLRIVLVLCRNLADGDIVTLVVVVNVRFHLEQVDDTLERILRTHRDLNHDCIFAQPLADLLDSAVEIRTDDIHLIDKCHTGNIVGVCLTPYVL